MYATTQRPVARTPVRFLGLSLVAWICLWVVLAVAVGGIYSVWLARTTPAAPALPAGPPHAVKLAHTSGTDMLDGNFVTTMALYRSTDAPQTIIAYYRALFRGQHPQFGNFDQLVYTTSPTRTPAAALQHVPPIFNTPNAGDTNAAKYVYTEYSRGKDDVAVAIDMRHPHGPTLVYMEMLTSPT